MNPIVLSAIGFSIAALTFALCAAWGFARSTSPAPRYRRSPQRYDGAVSAPEADAAPFPNLLSTKGGNK